MNKTPYVGAVCRKDHSSGEGFLEKVKLNKIALSMDKEWRGFFVPKRKG
jgi:hypothetical protein